MTSKNYIKNIIDLEEFDYHEAIDKDYRELVKSALGEPANRLYTGYIIETNEGGIFLLIEDYQQCCETYGYFFCNENYNDFIGAEIYSANIVDEALDKKHFLVNESVENEANLMFFNIETDRGTLQFVAYNAHNGHYGHRCLVKNLKKALYVEEI